MEGTIGVSAMDKNGNLIWDVTNSDLKMMIVNEDKEIAFALSPGPDGIVLTFTPEVCSQNCRCFSSDSSKDTFLSVCYADHCEKHSFHVFQQTLLHPFVPSTLVTHRSIIPLFLNDSHHTNGLYNPRLQVQYSFLLSFTSCSWVNDTSRCFLLLFSHTVDVRLTYTAETTVSLLLVPSLPASHS